MAFIYEEPSRPFGESLLIPNLTTKESVPSNVDLTAPLVRYSVAPDRAASTAPRASNSALTINVPVTSALMQSVSGADLAIALARMGGVSFVFSSQSVE